ncbi:S8 family serine peptidase [Tahibacter sp.]|uniref:S8 family serine peptidase n=1 Tax=Tahibacter sp. TaxID=2056211 RepID=UPI0028C4035A|nr:S8 family serine peptidase [Tahibacter sp.]
MKSSLSPFSVALAATLWSGFAVPASVSTPLVARALHDASLTAAAGLNGTELRRHKPDTGGGAKPKLLTAPSSLERARHTVVLEDLPLASYDGSLSGSPTLPRSGNGAHQGRVDVNSSAAHAYLDLLTQKQNTFIANASAQVGRALAADLTLRHAVNAVILDLSDAEAEALRQRGDVMLVERERQLELLTDRGPAFIGAPSIWDGTASGGVATKGEGIVAAVLDSGINWQSPAFAATGPIDGYVHVNPLGAGNYLGLCGPTPPNADLGRCNSKLIGMYNFTSTAPTRSATDDDGHGSHTASTVAGNGWDAPFGGGTFRLSGVAPHANVVAYKVCVGTCPSSAITQAANQAVADGIVDVMNFSISGGGSPWTEANSVAFLGANNAGIFVAASAGNSGPAAGTSDHQEPWVQTVAASTHDRVLGFNLDATGPGTPPANTQGIPLRPGAPPIQVVDFYNVPFVKSPGFASGTADGCAAFPADTFTRPYAPPADRVFADGFDPPTTPPPVGAIAVLNLDQNDSGCGSGVRQMAAVNAGAIGVIFVDPFYINLGAAGNAWSMLRSNWDNLALLDPATATMSITRPARTYPGTGDVVADFSSRGPRALANNQWLVKPDIAAPGVDILAAYQANVTATSNPNETALENGTSMASPHMAGAAVLMRALHPTWTPMQIKSALMLTSRTSGLVKQSGQPSDAWDRGAGRVDLVAAAKAGLVLDETGANFLAANPATGGNVANLNLPSLATANCIGTCTYTRTVRRALTGAQTYTVSTTGFPGTAVAVTPSGFTIGSSGTHTLTITVQSQLLPEAAWALGEIVLTPSNPAESTLHMPVAVRPGGPVIATTPTALSALSASSGLTDVKTLTIRNTGNPTLNWTIATSGPAQVTLLDTATTGNGQQAGVYTGSARGDYWAQNFDVAATTRVTTLRANGFTLPNTLLTTSNTPAVTFSIYADAAGVPAGAPQGFGAAPLWSYSNTIATANGISTSDGNLQLNLTAANVAANPLDLPPGRYWLMVWPTITGQGNNTAGNPLWAWRVSSNPQIGAPPQRYAPWDDPANWQFDADTRTMSAFVQGTVDCTQPAWISYSNTGGALGFAGQTTTDAMFNAAGLAAGTYRATLCLTSNATNAATLPVPLEFTVTRQPPTLSNAFAPAAITTTTTSTLTVTLANPNPVDAVLTHAFVDRLPPGVFVAPVANAATTCVDGSVTANAEGTAVTLVSDARIPANGSCTVTVDVRSRYPQTYTQTIAPGALRTNAGDNAASASAALAVASIGMGSFPPAETFDSVVPPALPPGWTTSAVGSGVPFVTQASLSHTAPNALFVPEQETQGQSFLTSPTVTVAAGARLTFRHRVRTEEYLDGGTLELSVDGGAFTNAEDLGVLFVSGAFGGSIARVTDCDAEPLAPYGWVTNTGSGSSGTSAVNIVLPNAMAGRDVAFRWRHGSDCSVMEDGGGWWIDSINLDTGNGITLETAFEPTNSITGTIASEVITLGSTRADPVTLTAALTTNLPTGLAFADPPNASTTCANGAITAVAGTRALTFAAGAIIPAFGTCTVRYDVVTTSMGMYRHTIAASALKTSGGNNLQPTSAIYQAVTPGVPTMTTGFEPPQFAIGGLPQLAWLGANGIFNANPATGVQHARVLSNGGNYPIQNASALISPTFAQGATQYSIATAKMAIGNIGTGSSWFFKPVNEELTPPITYVKFDRGTRAIAVYDAAVGGFVDTGSLWPDAAYFEVKIIVERATKALRVCLNGATIYTGVAGNAHMRLLEFGGVMEGGSNGSTFDVDDVTLDNVNTDGGCTP